MKDAALWVIAFVLTWAEVVICTKGARADRQSTYAATSRRSNEAALYEGLHEVVILAYMVLIVKESLWLALPVITAAVLSKRWALEKRRKKWRANAGNRPRKRRKLDNSPIS